MRSWIGRKPVGARVTLMVLVFVVVLVPSRMALQDSPFYDALLMSLSAGVICVPAWWWILRDEARKREAKKVRAPNDPGQTPSS